MYAACCLGRRAMSACAAATTVPQVPAQRCANYTAFLDPLGPGGYRCKSLPLRFVCNKTIPTHARNSTSS
jgi:hypothetical protein